VGVQLAWEHANQLTGGLDPLMVSYNESIYFDRAFHTQDILGSIAWARANHKAGILTAAEFSAIDYGLKKVEEEWVAGTFKIIPGVDEDIHTANERRLGEIIGKDIGGKLHTGRSRNEQVATDMRLWLRDELRKIESHLVDFLKVMTARAEKEISVIMPGEYYEIPAFTFLLLSCVLRLWEHISLIRLWLLQNNSG
jgi:argininosuccinate lyase